MTATTHTPQPPCTVAIEVQFVQAQIRIAQEDFNRAKLRLQALEALMPQVEDRMEKKKGSQWRAPLSTDEKKKAPRERQQP